MGIENRVFYAYIMEAWTTVQTFGRTVIQHISGVHGTAPLLASKTMVSIGKRRRSFPKRSDAVPTRLFLEVYGRRFNCIVLVVFQPKRHIIPAVQENFAAAVLEGESLYPFP